MPPAWALENAGTNQAHRPTGARDASARHAAMEAAMSAAEKSKNCASAPASAA